MSTYLHIISKKLGLYILMVAVLLFPIITNCQTTSVWANMELTGDHFKIIGTPTVPEQETGKKVPLWIPITTGGVIGGAITWIILTKDDASPTANDDEVTVPCGETTATVNVLGNDTGESLTITNVGTPFGVTATISGGNLIITGIGSEGFPISYTIENANGKTATAIVHIRVIDNEPPMVTCPPEISVSCSTDYLPQLTGFAEAVDACDQVNTSVGYSDDTSGLTGCNNTGTIIRTWTAFDFTGNSSSCTQTITVSPDETPPTIECPSAITIQCGADTNPVNTGSPTNADDCPAAPTIDFSDDLTGLTGCNGTGTLIRTFTATDACGNQQNCTQEITLEDTAAPNISCPDNITVSCENETDPSSTGTPTTDDACGTDLTTVFEDDLSGLTGCSGTGDLVRTWTATDDCSNEQTCTQTITVVDETAPQIDCPAATVSPCTSPHDPAITGQPTYADNCSSSIEIIFEDDNSNIVNCTGDLIRTWTATDECGNSASCDQSITITDDAPPTISCPNMVTVECGDSIDPNETGTATADYSCGSPTSGTIDFSDDNTGLTGCNGTGTISRTWTATDSCGLQSNCTQTITIEDTTAPVITCPANTTVACDESTNPSQTGTATGSDECGGSVEIQFSDDNSGLNGCNGTGELIRTWTATDDCGNPSNCNQQISVIDISPPTIICPPNTTAVCLEPNDPSITGQPTSVDNCSTNPTNVYVDDMSGVVNCEGDMMRTWTAIDDCGNSSECIQIITIIPPDCTFTTTFDIQDADCGVSNGIAFANVSPPSGNYIYEWSNGATGPILSDVPTDNYSVTITDVSLSCFLVFDVFIGELPASYVSGLEVIPADCPSGGDIFFTVATPGSGPIEVNVQGPLGNFVISNVPNGAEVHLMDFVNVVPGVYDIQVVDVSAGPDCIEQFSVQVDQVPPYQLQVVQVNPPSSPSNNDGSIVMQVDDPNHPPPYTIFLNGNPIGNTPDVIIIIQNLPEGVYEIQVTDANGCPSEVIVVELFAMSKPTLILPTQSKLTLLPNLTTKGTVEHPTATEWTAVDYIPHSWQAAGSLWPLKNGLEMQLGIGRSQGVGKFTHPAFSDQISVSVSNLSFTQAIQKPIEIETGTLRFGAIFSQNYFKMNAQNPLPNAKFSNPWQFNFGLQSSFEFKLNDLLNFQLPLGWQIGGNGKTDFWMMPTIVLKV